MEKRSIDVVSFDPQLYMGKMFFRIFSDEFEAKGFHRGDLLIIDREKPLTDGCKVVVISKGVFHIREIMEENHEFFIKPEEGEFFIPLLITEKIRKGALAGLIVTTIRDLKVVPSFKK